MRDGVREVFVRNMASASIQNCSPLVTGLERVHCDHVSACVGVFIARGREDALVTKNLVPGESVYGEKRITIEVSVSTPWYVSM